MKNFYIASIIQSWVIPEVSASDLGIVKNLKNLDKNIKSYNESFKETIEEINQVINKISSNEITYSDSYIEDDYFVAYCCSDVRNDNDALLNYELNISLLYYTNMLKKNFKKYALVVLNKNLGTFYDIIEILKIFN
jgi:hypothetical protein